MKRLHKLLVMDADERRVLLSALAAMVLVRLALLVLPLHRVMAGAREINRRWPRRFRTPLSSNRVALRISQASRFSFVPVTCLSESIAAQFVMQRWNFATLLRIGVARTGGNLEAHAWLESSGGIVIGNPSPAGKEYTPLPSLERFST